MHFFSWCLQPSGITGLLSWTPLPSPLPPPQFNHHLARFSIFSSFYLSPQVHPPKACNHFVILLWDLSSLSACVWNWGSPRWLHHYKYILLRSPLESQSYLLRGMIERWANLKMRWHVESMCCWILLSICLSTWPIPFLDFRFLRRKIHAQLTSLEWISVFNLDCTLEFTSDL